jgi:uncharacterized protein (TIGR03435 family)
MARVIVGVVIVAILAFAQTPATPRFEVASIKPTAHERSGMGTFHPSPGGRLTVANMTLKGLIQIAWEVQSFQISGGPAWIDSVCYDISAKAENGFNAGEVLPMVQSLLADRFHVAIHKEAKELPVYKLVLSRKDGDLGPQLRVAKDGSCEPYDATKAPPRREPNKPPALPCGYWNLGLVELRGASIDIARMVRPLSRVLGRTVVDQTGLTGKYDLTLRWTPDEAQMALSLPPDAPNLTRIDSTGPSIFVALQEQLGLKLESAKGPVEVLVIDHVERPGEN